MKESRVSSVVMAIRRAGDERAGGFLIMGDYTMSLIGARDRLSIPLNATARSSQARAIDR